MPPKKLKFSSRSFFGKLRHFSEKIFPRPMWDQTYYARSCLGETFQPKMFIFKDNRLMPVEVSILHRDILAAKQISVNVKFISAYCIEYNFNMTIKQPNSKMCFIC